MTDPENPSMRASDEDRATVAERLRVAVNEGRLRVDEYDDRLGRAYAAATRADLAPLTADLPAPEPAAPPAEATRKERDRRKVVKEWRDWAGTSFVLVAIWAATSLFSGDLNFFWPVIPMGIWAVFLVAGMVSGFGGSSCGGGEDEADDDPKGTATH